MFTYSHDVLCVHTAILLLPLSQTDGLKNKSDSKDCLTRNHKEQISLKEYIDSINIKKAQLFDVELHDLCDNLN